MIVNVKILINTYLDTLEEEVNSFQSSLANVNTVFLIPLFTGNQQTLGLCRKSLMKCPDKYDFSHHY